MIKKSVCCFMTLAILHLCFVLFNPSTGMATHQWQDNVLKAQQFMYAEMSDTVMVGTSLSARIIRDSIPFVKSVSFGGCAVEDGLKIILSKGNAPKYVLVETNLLLREGNTELVYVDETNAYYNFTSDFGPGSFEAVSGEKNENIITLKDDRGRTLILEETGDGFMIKSFTLE